MRAVYSEEGRSDEERKLQEKYFLPVLFIDLLRRLANAQRDFLAKDVLGYLTRARALVNTARSIGPHGLTKPQIFFSLLIVAWNFTQACNLRRQTLLPAFNFIPTGRDKEIIEHRDSCGGCRARACGYFGDLTEADPGCINNQEKWAKEV